jgi:hypothetical protein
MDEQVAKAAKAALAGLAPVKRNRFIRLDGATRSVNRERSFRMSKHDLKARPVYHHKRESIDARLTVVFAALAVTRLIEHRTGWSIKKCHATGRADRHQSALLR